MSEIVSKNDLLNLAPVSAKTGAKNEPKIQIKIGEEDEDIKLPIILNEKELKNAKKILAKKLNEDELLKIEIDEKIRAKNEPKKEKIGGGEGSFLNTLLRSIDELNKALPERLKITKKELMTEAMSKIKEPQKNEDIFETSILDSAPMMSILKMLDNLQIKTNEVKFNKLAKPLQELIKHETNFTALRGAKNLSELLKVAQKLELNISTIKIEGVGELKELKNIFSNLNEAKFFDDLFEDNFSKNVESILNTKFKKLVHEKLEKLSQNEVPKKEEKKTQPEPKNILSQTLKKIELKNERPEKIQGKIEPRVELKSEAKIEELSKKILAKIQPVENKVVEKKTEPRQGKVEIQPRLEKEEVKEVQVVKNEPSKKVQNKEEEPKKYELKMAKNEEMKEPKKEEIKEDKKEKIEPERPEPKNQTLPKREKNEDLKNLKEKISQTLKEKIPERQKSPPKNEAKNEAKVEPKIEQKLENKIESKIEIKQDKIEDIKEEKKPEKHSNEGKENKQEHKDEGSRENKNEGLNSIIKDLAKINQAQVKNPQSPIEPRQTMAYFVEDLREAISQYKSPITRLNISLNPANLGEVEVSLIQRGNNLHINFNSNSNALNIFIQHQGEFKNSLVNMGFTGLEMNFNDQGKKEQGEPRRNRNGRGFDELIENEQVSSLELVLARYF